MLAELQYARSDTVYIYTYSMMQNIFENVIVARPVREYPAFFMEHEGSLKCSQKAATGPYPERHCVCKGKVVPVYFLT
jgi:hypothetical protein